jgi:hypothetical protein
MTRFAMTPRDTLETLNDPIQNASYCANLLAKSVRTHSDSETLRL